jgi:hypothetical protein
MALSLSGRPTYIFLIAPTKLMRSRSPPRSFTD